MKKVFLTLILLFIITISLHAQSKETLNYIVTYKWGLIQKDAGEVTINKVPNGNGYELKLLAKTKPWADRIYKVRDTLTSITHKEKYKPLDYTYIAHEKNRYKRDDIKYSYNGNKVKAETKRFREKNGEVTQSQKVLEGELPAYDMLSVYFFLRDIDYANLKPGETVKATIFSGEKIEQLEVRCEGKEMVKLRDKTEHEAWHILFKFTTGGGKKSSDDINCWISTDPPYIPLLIIGNLPIGQVRVNYVSSQ